MFGKSMCEEINGGLYTVGHEKEPTYFCLQFCQQELSSSRDGRPWPQQTWAEKRGLLCPFRGGAGSPSNTMWPGPRSTSLPDGVFIHPAVRPQ